MRALRFHWPSQIPDGKGVSDKKSHSKDQTLSEGARVDGAGHETTSCGCCKGLEKPGPVTVMA